MSKNIITSIQCQVSGCCYIAGSSNLWSKPVVSNISNAKYYVVTCYNIQTAEPGYRLAAGQDYVIAGIELLSCANYGVVIKENILVCGNIVIKLYSAV